VLEQAAVLSITRQRASNGGRNLPSVYTLHEAPAREIQGGESELASRRNGTGRAAERYSQGEELKLASRRNGTGRAAERYSPGGDSATPGFISPLSITRAGKLEEEDLETSFPSDMEVRAVPEGRGEGERMRQVELCEALLQAWEPALGDTPRRDYETRPARWLQAAAQLLARHPRERLDGALAYMVTDEILGSQALTMAGFAKVADQLIVRAYARRQRETSRTTNKSGAGEGLGWETAKQRLQRAVHRHGREGRAAAVRELGEHSELLVRFVERVRWGSLCERPFEYVDRQYAEVWTDLVREGHDSRREPTT